MGKLAGAFRTLPSSPAGSRLFPFAEKRERLARLGQFPADLRRHANRLRPHAPRCAGGMPPTEFDLDPVGYSRISKSFEHPRTFVSSGHPTPKSPPWPGIGISPAFCPV